MEEKENNHIKAVVIPTKVRYEKEGNDWKAYNCKVKTTEQMINLHPIYKSLTITGEMSKLEIGEEYEVEIEEDTASKYPASYKLKSLSFVFPTDTASQKKYIQATIGENKMNAIYDYYVSGENVIELILERKLDYTNIKGLGEATFEKLRDRVLASAPKKATEALLKPFGVTSNAINKIFSYYHNDDLLTVDSITNNPYELTNVANIGFKLADFIALKLNHSRTSPFRINSALAHVLETIWGDGDTWILKEDLVKQASALMGINRKYVENEILTENYKQMFIKEVDGRFTMLNAYNDERFISTALLTSDSNPVRYFTDEEIEDFLTRYQIENDITLEEKQLEFFYNWNNNTISFLVGGAGMGKTALMTILVRLLETKDITSQLMAPTGKSSKVLAEYVGREASTIHRALNLRKADDEESKSMTKEERKAHEILIAQLKKQWRKEKKEEANKSSEDAEHKFYQPLDTKSIIVDEVSMADVDLISTLLGRIDLSHTKILFVGDDYQLPSVGVGNFLYDCIHSDIAHVTRLHKVFRQDEGGILDIATKVRQGKPFLKAGMEGPRKLGSDCVIDLTNQSSVPYAVDYYYENLLSEGLSPEEIMVLSPAKAGKSGTIALNNRVQNVVDPDGTPEYKGLRVDYDKYNYTVFHVGDLVMNTVNGYDRPATVLDESGVPRNKIATIFNGDTGKVVRIVGNELYAQFDGITFKFSAGQVKSMLLHSYCITIHKSQGSASKAVILVLDKSATFQLNANLIYTGITRAKEKLIIIGQADTIINSGRKFINMKRKSFLGDMLAGKI